MTFDDRNFAVEIEGESILLCSFSYTERDASWINHYEQGDNAAAQTFSIDLGEEAADRVIVIAGAGATNNRTISSVTIDAGGGPVAMTVHNSELYAGIGGPGGFNGVTIFEASLLVPTGTSATVVVTYSGLLSGSFIDVHRMTGLLNPSGPSATAKTSATGASNPSVNIDVASNGILIGVFAATDNGYPGNIANFGPVTWTGIGTENSDEAIGTVGSVLWGSSALQSGLAAQTGRTVSATNVVTGRKAIMVGAWY